MNGHILIVENEIDIADVMRRYLEFEGFRIAWAATVHEARARLASAVPALIVLDWHLPDADSDSLLGEIRNREETADVPIIMMTGGYPSVSLMSQLTAANIPLLIKPFSLELFVEQIKGLVQRERVVGAA